jgi:cytosine/adenosine deaminase-related metal-dependent hydrolase
VRYLHNLGFFERPVTLIHGNYVPEEDFDVIAKSGSSVVFCPRSHRYFRHREHPFRSMLGHGINVALGTDSLISSPTLSILDEMKFIRTEFPELDGDTILRMATINGLKTMGLHDTVDPFEPGFPADITGVALTSEALERAECPLEAVLAEHSEVIFSMVGGKILFNAGRSET